MLVFTTICLFSVAGSAIDFAFSTSLAKLNSTSSNSILSASSLEISKMLFINSSNESADILAFLAKSCSSSSLSNKFCSIKVKKPTIELIGVFIFVSHILQDIDSLHFLCNLALFI